MLLEISGYESGDMSFDNDDKVFMKAISDYLLSEYSEFVLQIRSPNGDLLVEKTERLTHFGIQK